MLICLKWFHNRFWPLWWPVSSFIRVQTTLNHIRFVFYHSIKDNERNLSQHLFTIENTDSKVHVCIMQMSYLYASDFPFTRSTCRSIKKKNVWEKSNDASSLAIRVYTMINHISICFLPQHQHQRKCIFSERVEKDIARHIDASSVNSVLSTMAN